ARRADSLHAALHDDGDPPGDRPGAGRDGGRGVLPEPVGARTDDHDGVDELRHIGNARRDPRDRPPGRRADGPRPLPRAALSCLAGVQPVSGGTSLALGKAHAARPRLQAPPAIVLKLAGGLALLLVWEIVVRSLAPAYVARPTGIARVFVD